VTSRCPTGRQPHQRRPGDAWSGQDRGRRRNRPRATHAARPAMWMVKPLRQDPEIKTLAFRHRAATSEIRATSGSHVATSGGAAAEERSTAKPGRPVPPAGRGIPTESLWKCSTIAPSCSAWRTGSSRTPGPNAARASDRRCREGRPPKHLRADASRHSDVDARIHRWMPASDGGGRALQSNYS